MKKLTAAEFIADLYVCRAGMYTPSFGRRELQDTHEVLKYNWLNTIISKLSDEYDVHYEDVALVFKNKKT